MHNKSVAQLVKGLRERQFSSVEVTRTYLDRIAALDCHYNSFISVDAAAALADGGYDWREKVQFQLAPGELAELAAALFHPGVALRLVGPQGLLLDESRGRWSPRSRDDLPEGS